MNWQAAELANRLARTEGATVDGLAAFMPDDVSVPHLLGQLEKLGMVRLLDEGRSVQVLDRPALRIYAHRLAAAAMSEVARERRRSRRG